MDSNNQIENTQANLELIDAYLLGKLDTDELAEFNSRMDSSAAFRLMVEEQRAVMQGIEEQNLQKTLDGYHAEIKEEPQKKWLSREWLALAASLVILIGVSTWAILNNSNSPEKVFSSNFKPDPGLPTTMGTSSDYDFYHGMVNYKRKEYAEAIHRWESLYAAHPDNDTVVYFLGVANLANGNARQAEKYLQLAKKESKSVFSEEIRFYLALALLKGNKIEEAKTVLENSETAANKLLLKEIEGL